MLAQKESVIDFPKQPVSTCSSCLYTCAVFPCQQAAELRLQGAVFLVTTDRPDYSLQTHFERLLSCSMFDAVNIYSVKKKTFQPSPREVGWPLCRLLALGRASLHVDTGGRGGGGGGGGGKCPCVYILSLLILTKPCSES